MSAAERPTRELVDVAITRADLLREDRVVPADIDVTAFAMLADEVRALRAELEAGEPPEPDPCRASEGMSGIDCALSAGHDLPHRGWWCDEHDMGGEFAVYIEWPMPDRPDMSGGAPRWSAPSVVDGPTECGGCESPLCPTHGRLR